MSLRSVIRVLAVPVTIAGLIGLAGCGGAKEEPVVAEVKASPARVRVMNTLPRFRFQDQNGERFGSKELDGKVWIATFVFTNCPSTCPRQTAEIAKLQNELADHPASADIRFVSITVDPKNDTSAVLRAYAEKAGADPSRWVHLTGFRDEIWRLSKDGFKLPVTDAADDPATLIAHSRNFVLVDRARRVRGHYDGLDEKAREKLKRDLDLVLNDPRGPLTVRREKPEDKGPGPKVYEPLEIKDTPWLEERARAQAEAIKAYGVFHGFRFTDRLPESGITFVNSVVEDAGKLYKGVHYDHGNGVVVADIDGDGLYDIYFVNQVGSNGLFRNLGGGKFEDVTESAGVGVPDRISVTASFADTDNDGDPDLYVTTVRGGNLLFENDGTGKFTDIANAAGLAYNGHSASGVFFDYDGDGLLDLFLANPGIYTTNEKGVDGYYIGFADAFTGHLKPERTEQSILYRNKGGNRFEDVSQDVLADESWTGAASPIDVNEDGWPDLYVTSMEGHDEYYENQGGKKFVRKSREVFPRTPWGAMGIQVFDFNNDGLMDIYVTDMHTDMVDDLVAVRRFWYAEKLKMTETYGERFLATDGNHVEGNAFFLNEGGGKFREVSDQIGAENYWPWGLSTADVNADGFIDAFVTSSMNYPYRYGVNSLLLNNNGEEFVDSEFVVGVEPRRDRQTAKPWFNLDCDDADREHLLCTDRSGPIEVWGSVGTRSSVIFDLDNDGDLDIVTNEFNSEPMVLVSDLMEAKPDTRYLMVDLVGQSSNRGGVGARVAVKAGGQTYTQVLDGQSGYISQSLYPLYFGLGGASEVDEIEVTWPSRGTQVVAGPIATNQVLTITEE